MNPADTCDVSATADTERGQINVQKHAIKNYEIIKVKIKAF